MGSRAAGETPALRATVLAHAAGVLVAGAHGAELTSPGGPRSRDVERSAPSEGILSVLAGLFLRAQPSQHVLSARDPTLFRLRLINRCFFTRSDPDSHATTQLQVS